MEALPSEVVLHCLSFLDHTALVVARYVCREWNHYCMEDFLWKPLFLRRFEAHVVSEGRWWEQFMRTFRRIEHLGIVVVSWGETVFAELGSREMKVLRRIENDFEYHDEYTYKIRETLMEIWGFYTMVCILYPSSLHPPPLSSFFSSTVQPLPVLASLRACSLSCLPPSLSAMFLGTSNV